MNHLLTADHSVGFLRVVIKSNIISKLVQYIKGSFKYSQSVTLNINLLGKNVWSKFKSQDYFW